MPALLLAVAACRESAPVDAASELPSLAQGRQGLRSPLDNVGDIFLGQAAPNLASVNLLDGRGLNAPEGLALDTSVSPPRVYVADTANSRVLAWSNVLAFANGAPADKVIGQTDQYRSACNTTGVSATTLCSPRAVEVDASGNLYVADTNNNRVLEFNAPFATDLIADRVFGQGGSFFTTTCNLGGGPSATTLCTPTGLAVDGTGDLHVSDQGNHRVLRYASPLSDQVADGVLGQTSLARNAPNRVDERGLTNPTRLAIDVSVTPNRIYVADTDNHRVLGWSSATGFASGAPADKVIGQPDFETSGCNTGGAGARTLCYPRGVTVDAAGNLYVADTNNNRVLVFDAPFTSDAVADQVWGQAAFTGVACNSGGLGAGTLCGPWGVGLDTAGNLLVADSGNHRVLLFNGGRMGDTLADQVSGQTGFTTGTCNTGGISAQTLCNPRGLALDASGNIYVADYGNSRVLEYNASPLDAVADRAFGQASMTSGACNAGGISGSSLCNPGSVAVDGAGNVWVGDEGNARVLGYLTPLTSGLVADKVVGRSSVTSNGCSTPSATCLATSAPAVAVDATGNLYVADPAAHRVLAYNTPFASGGDTTADRILGQTDFENTSRNSIDAAGLNGPTGVHVDRFSNPNRLFVADSSNSRVLAWSSVPLTSGQAADRVFGQAASTTGLCNKGGPGAGNLCTPLDMATDAAGNLYISDNNSRVLEYNAPFGTSGDAVADRVFGQKDFAATSCNSGGISALSLCQPRALGVAPSGEVFVVDSGNHRVLRYDAPLSTDLSADAVLGQGGFRNNGSNLVDGAGFASPYAVALDTSVTPGRLYVADNDNSRVLAWADITSFQNGSPADLVLGQPDLLGAGCNSQGVSASSLCEPTGVTVDSRGRVYVADTSNHRVLLYDSPFTTDTVADKVMGQADFIKNSCNRGLANPSAISLCEPHGVVVSPASEVFISDLDNDRVLAYLDPWGTDLTADFVFGKPDFITSGCNKGGVSASSLCDPYHLALDVTLPSLRLYVADSGNDRVLEYDAPLSSDRVADLVIGKTGMTSTGCGTTNATSLCDPKSIAVDSFGNIYVVDNDDDRVLQYNSPRTTDASADRVFGQTSFGGSSCNAGGLSASSVCGPRGVALDSAGSLYVADTTNHRVVIYLANNRPTATPLTLTPSAPKTEDDLTGDYTYHDVDGDAESGTQVRWYRNGEEQVAFAGLLTVPASATARGEQWHFTVRPRDGVESGKQETSPKVTIGNTLPVASTPTLSPAPPRTDDVLSAQYTYADADGDVESGSEIHWFLDNEEQSALLNQRTVPASATARGQFWYFTVRPSDGTATGTPVTSPVVPIANTPPSAGNVQISPASPSSASSLGVSYTYVDPDGDAELGSEIRWFKNGVHQSELDNARTVLGPLTLNDQWFYTLSPRDGTSLGSLVTSTTVVVGSSAPTATDVRISPNPLRTDDALTASYTYSDPDKQLETSSRIRWFKNDIAQPAHDNLQTVPASATTKGDKWSFTVTPCDPTPLCGPTQTSPVVTVANTAPVVTSLPPTITPAAPKTSDALTTSYTYADADGDAQSGSEIRWFKNGEEQPALANLNKVPAGTAAKGQNWYYILRPKDGADFGAAVTSSTVTIANTSPTATQLALAPASPRVTDTLSASYTYSDVDQDPESKSQSGSGVKWLRNNTEDPTLRNAPSVPPSKLAKGQSWKFTVTPSDGTVLGPTVTSSTVTIQNSPPVVANLSISPANPNAGEALTATYAFSDADNDAQLNSEIRWFKNGVEQTAFFNQSTVPAGSTAKGQKWSFSVRPKDGTDFGPPLTSAEVSIANNAPLASSLAIQPAQPGTDDNLVAAYTFADTDGDPESGTEIRWFRNGTEAQAYVGLKTLPASATAKGESWYVTVKPKDGTDFGQLVTSTPVLILNTAPRATNVNLSPLSPKATDPLVASYTYVDPDGDEEQGTELRWYRNEVEVTALVGQRTVPAGTAKAAETWYFTVKPKDGVAFGSLVTSTSVIVGSSAPVATALQITPFAPSAQDALVANYLYSDPDGEPESGSEINWYRNATLVASLAGLKTVPAGTARKGEAWSFSVRPKDGLAFGATQTSAAVALGNTVPSATNALLNPAQPRTDDALQAVYTFADPDGDAQSGSEIRWYRNGLEQPSLFNQTVVPASATTKREVWYYRVRPRDGSDHGPAEVSSPVFIENSPPVANAGLDQTIPPTQEVMRVTLDGVGSRDADGDVLDYTWSEGGTVLGRGSRVAVDLPIGKHTLVLSVGDGEGTTTDEVLIDIPAPKPTATVPADFTASPGRVVLVGTGSDPLNRALDYQWTQVSGEPVELHDADKATAWFLGTRAGARTFELVASAGASSDPVRTTVTVLDLAPWASVPTRRVVAVGREVTLDGSGSADPNGDALGFRWTLEFGAERASLTDADQPKARLTPHRDGRYSAVLVVNDGTQDSASGLTELIAVDPLVTSHVPVANAGPDGVGESGQPLLLEGRGSYDVDGDALTYAWRKISGPGEAPTPPTSPTPTLRTTGAGTVVLGLTVSDGKTTSPEDRVTFEISDSAVNRRPVARAGADRSVAVGAVLQLDATRSTDPDGDVLTYQWTQLAGPKVTLDDERSPKPSFTPTRTGFVRLALTVSDGKLTSVPASVLVQVTTGSNRPPLANAGADQQVIIGDVVTLNGSGSSDPDGQPLRYAWEQVWGSPVVLEGSDATPRFTPPGKGRYRFRLTVWDGEVPSSPDEVDVVLSTHGADNKTPVAVVGGEVEVGVGEKVTVEGTGSHDPDPLDKLSYEWTLAGFPTGNEPVLADGTTATPSFTPTVPGAYTLRLRVSDGDLTSAPAYATVMVQADSKGGPLGCSSGTGAPLPLAALLLLIGRRRMRWARVLAVFLALGVAWTPGSADAGPRKVVRSKSSLKMPKKGKGKRKPLQKAPVEAPPSEEPPADELAAPLPFEDPEAVTPATSASEPSPQTPVPSEGPPNPYLEEARQLYLSFQFEEILPKLEFALAVKGVTPAQRVEIYKLMALTHSAFDDAVRAEESFLHILELKPDYELTGGASPKIRSYFASAQKAYRARQAVKLRHSPPKPNSHGGTTTVDVAVTAGVDRVAAMTLHYRPRGSTSGFSQLGMARGEDGAFSGNVPNAFPGPAGKRTIEYFIRARDASGGLLSSVGGEQAPLELTMETVALTVSTPVYKSWLFWTAVGVGAAAAVVTPVVFNRDAAVRPGTIGMETLK
ncbi:PKD domain-containing protein [Archangium sp.]|uniref:PKD domain-containing protein n=1 Tax=Archangium sp. TaxID=1872627 RepID=UPI002ED8E333